MTTSPYLKSKVDDLVQIGESRLFEFLWLREHLGSQHCSSAISVLGIVRRLLTSSRTLTETFTVRGGPRGCCDPPTAHSLQRLSLVKFA